MSQEEERAAPLTFEHSGWTHAGLIIGRGLAGSFDAGAVADPCISFDSELMRWGLFYTGRTEFEQEVCAQVLSRRPDLIGPGEWLLAERSPLPLTNPEVLAGKNWSQPCPVFEPLRSSYEPALIDGRYWLLFSVWSIDEPRAIYAASSSSLSGPWTVQESPVLSGAGQAFGTPGANWFPARQRILLYYSAQAYIGALSWQPGEDEVQDLGIMLAPGAEKSAWVNGPLQGLQLLPGQKHAWYGLLNTNLAGSGLAGFAYTDEEWPVSGWQFMPEPIERLEDIPGEALGWGEGEKLGRHSLLILPGGGLRLFYESGPAGNEQIFLKRARQ